MTTVKLTNVTLEVTGVNLQKNSGGPSVGLSAPTSGTGQTVYTNAQIKIGDKAVTGYNHSFTLTDDEATKTNISGLEDLAVVKIKAELGI